jgi:hypothetical protein
MTPARRWHHLLPYIVGAIIMYNQQDVGGINYINAAGAYPAMGGESIAMQAGAFSDMGSMMPTNGDMPQDITMASMPDSSAAMSSMAAMPMGAPTPAGQPHRSPAMWWLMLVILLVALMWAAEHFGSEGPYFSNIRLSVYNIVVLTFAVVLGLTVLKAGAQKFPNNAVSELIIAA